MTNSPSPRALRPTTEYDDVVDASLVRVELLNALLILEQATTDDDVSPRNREADSAQSRVQLARRRIWRSILTALRFDEDDRFSPEADEELVKQLARSRQKPQNARFDAGSIASGAAVSPSNLADGTISIDDIDSADIDTGDDDLDLSGADIALTPTAMSKSYPPCILCSECRDRYRTPGWPDFENVPLYLKCKNCRCKPG